MSGIFRYLDRMSPPNLTISTSDESTDKEANGGGTNRSANAVDSPKISPTSDVLPSIEVPQTGLIDNQVMDYVLQRRPDLTRGEVLFFSLPLRIRYIIYDYDERLHRPTSPAKSDRRLLSVNTPLSQTCRTFRREMKGRALSRFAIFKAEDEFKKFVKGCRAQGFSPYLSALSFNIAWPESKLRSLDNVRSVLQRASEEFKYITVLVFHIQSARDSDFDVLRKLMQDGTIARFTSLELIHAHDRRIKERYNKNYNQRTRAFIHTKLREWMEVGAIQPEINTEVLCVARCMMRLNILNTEFITAVNRWRRDSAVVLEDENVEKSQSPQEDSASSEDVELADYAVEVGVDC